MQGELPYLAVHLDTAQVAGLARFGVIVSQDWAVVKTSLAAQLAPSLELDMSVGNAANKIDMRQLLDGTVEAEAPIRRLDTEAGETDDFFDAPESVTPSPTKHTRGETVQNKVAQWDLTVRSMCVQLTESPSSKLPSGTTPKHSHRHRGTVLKVGLVNLSTSGTLLDETLEASATLAGLYVRSVISAIDEEPTTRFLLHTASAGMACAPADVEMALAAAAAGAAFVTGRLTYCDARSKLFVTSIYDHTVAKVDVTLATIAVCIDRDHVAAVLALAGQFVRAVTPAVGATGSVSTSTSTAAASSTGASISTSISLVPLSASTPMRARTASQSLQAPSIQPSKTIAAGGVVAATELASLPIIKTSVTPSTLDGWIGYVTASTIGASVWGDATVVPGGCNVVAPDAPLETRPAAASGNLVIGTAARLTCSFASFQLQLVAANHSLAHVAVNNLSANVVIGTDSAVTANATLTDLCLRDLGAEQQGP